MSPMPAQLTNLPEQHYSGTKFLLEKASRLTLHELRGPIIRVIEILGQEANADDVLIALGAPVMLGVRPDQKAVSQAIARDERLLQDLL